MHENAGIPLDGLHIACYNQANSTEAERKADMFMINASFSNVIMGMDICMRVMQMGFAMCMCCGLSAEAY